MKIYLGEKKVGTNLVTLKRQIKIGKSPVAKDSIIELRWKKNIQKFKVLTSIVTRRKESFIKVNYQML